MQPPCNTPVVASLLWHCFFPSQDELHCSVLGSSFMLKRRKNNPSQNAGSLLNFIVTSGGAPVLFSITHTGSCYYWQYPVLNLMLDFDTDPCEKLLKCEDCQAAAAAPSECLWASCSNGEYQSVDVTLHNHGHCVGWWDAWRPCMGEEFMALDTGFWMESHQLS